MPKFESITNRYIPVLLVLSTIAVFFPVCSHEFINFDDYLNLTQNPLLNPPSWANLRQFWSPTYEFGFMPVTYMVWSGLAEVSRVNQPDALGETLNPYVFHTGNLLVHLISMVLVYALLRRLTGRSWASAAGAMVFAIHPLQVEPVAWATGMKDLLAGAFSFGALLGYVRFVQARQCVVGSALAAVNKSGRVGVLAHRFFVFWTRIGGRVHPPYKKFTASEADPGQSTQLRVAWRWYALATIAFVLALLSKPGAVTVPLLAIILDRFLLKRPWPKVIRATALWLCLATATMPITALGGGFTNSSYFSAPLWIRPLIALDALAFYFQKVGLPLGLSILYPRSPKLVLQTGQLAVTWMIPVGVLVVGWLLRRRMPVLLIATLVFVAAPLPVLGLLTFEYQRYTTVADRYIYVAMLGPALAMAYLLKDVRLVDRIVGVVAVSTVLLLYAILAFVQTGYWADSQTLFTRVLQVNPRSAVAYNNLSQVALNANRPVDAENLARNAIQYDPGLVTGYLNLGLALNQQHRTAEERDAYLAGYRTDDAWFKAEVLPVLLNAPADDPRYAVLRSLFDVKK